MMPAYAQATFTQVAPFIYEGGLVYANDNTTFAMKTNAKSHALSPLLWAGQPNILAIARRWGDAFLITLATQRNSNSALNLGRKDATASIRVPGINTTTVLALTARLQGSVYVYRSDTGAADPVVYLVDGWHGASHPAYWPATTTSALEAELFSGHLAHSGASVMHTARAEGAAEGDYRGSRTHVDLQAAARLNLPVVYSIVEHGLRRNTTTATVRVRVLMRPAESEASAFASANGERLILDDSAAVKTNRGWMWHAAEVTTSDAVELSGSASVDKLELSL